MSTPTIAGPTVIGGRYSVERQLGYGATATVYLCRDQETTNLVAVKVLRVELAESVGAERFLREIRLTSELSHPDILPVLDSGAEGSLLYCVLPYMDGGTLRDLLLKEKQLPIAQAVGIGATIAGALAYAHGRGLIHRDIKPENILFSNGKAYLGDFGIARALHATQGDLRTTTGVVRGTPMYMSPEQASGERDYDGRSDVYSLASVIYEMVSGMPPFVGPTSQSVLAQRFSSTPRPMSVYRTSVSPELERVIQKAMMTSPADRYGTAREFGDALEAVGRASAQVQQLRRPSSRAMVLAGAAAAVIIAAGAFALKGRATAAPDADTPPDTTLLAVVPFEREGDAKGPGSVEALLYDALSAWRGITVLEPFRVRDAVQRNAALTGVEQHRRVARSLHAGRYVSGVIIPLGEGWRIRAQLNDLSSDKPLKEAVVTVPASLAGLDALFAKLARTLLLGRLADTSDAVEATTNLSAIQSFGAGLDALDDWDFARADSAFQRAIEFDDQYSRAYLWQAQVRSWQPVLATTTWYPLVGRALASPARLSSREQQLAAGLQALGAGQFEKACGIYTAMRDRDERDFAAWYGLGQCHDRDTRVVRDAASPTGWRYVASYQAALDAYQRAFEVLAVSHRSFQRGAYEPLRKLLSINPSELRPASVVPPDTGHFYGRLDHDGTSLVARPYPIALIQAGGPSAVPRGMRKAIDQQKRLFARIASTWSTSLPRSAGAKEAVAVSLEMQGDPAARDTMRAAIALATDSLQRLRLRVAGLILDMKFAEPDDLSALDSLRERSLMILASRPSPSRAEARLLAPLAALVGKCALASDLSRRAVFSQSDIQMPADVVGEGDALGARVVLGCEPDVSRAVTGLRRRVAALGTAASPLTEPTLLGRTIRIMNPFDSTLIKTSIASSAGGYLLKTELAALRGDVAAVRAGLDNVVAARNVTGWDSVQPEAIYAESRVLLAIGDTAAAVQMLDRLLDRREFVTPGMLDLPIAMGSVMRVAALRADVAEARGERGAAMQWRQFVQRLWLQSDLQVRRAPAASSISR